MWHRRGSSFQAAPTLPISLETVSDSLLTKLATKPACIPELHNGLCVALRMESARAVQAGVRSAACAPSNVACMTVGGT